MLPLRRLTPLGNHLAQLPVDAGSAKLLAACCNRVLGLLSCLNLPPSKSLSILHSLQFVSFGADVQLMFAQIKPLATEY